MNLSDTVTTGRQEDKCSVFDTFVPLRSFRNVKVVSVSCGFEHTLLLDCMGALHSFGFGKYGQLGHGDRESLMVPKKVEIPSPAISMSGGMRFTAVVTDSGQLFTFGTGTHGELGEDKVHLMPTEFGGQWKSVACGAMHVIAIGLDGGVYSWGRAIEGQLGYEVRRRRNSRPCVVTKCYGTAVKVAAGDYHSVVVCHTGIAWVWGRCGHDIVKTPLLVELKDQDIVNAACGSKCTVLQMSDGSVNSMHGCEIKRYLRSQKDAIMAAGGNQIGILLQDGNLYMNKKCVKDTAKAVRSFDQTVYPFIKFGEENAKLQKQLRDAILSKAKKDVVLATEDPGVDHWVNANGRKQFFCPVNKEYYPRSLDHVALIEHANNMANNWNLLMSKKTSVSVPIKEVPILGRKKYFVMGKRKELFNLQGNKYRFVQFTHSKQKGQLLEWNKIQNPKPIAGRNVIRGDVLNAISIESRGLIFSNFRLRALRAFEKAMRGSKLEKADHNEMFRMLRDLRIHRNASNRTIKKLIRKIGTHGFVSESEYGDYAVKTETQYMRSIWPTNVFRPKENPIDRQTNFSLFRHAFKTECAKRHVEISLKLRRALVAPKNNRLLESGVLDLTYCGLNNDMACALAVALKVAPVLKKLDLRNNRITTPGAEAILGAVKFQVKLHEQDHTQICLMCNEVLEFLEGEDRVSCECFPVSRNGYEYLRPIYLLESVYLFNSVSNSSKVEQAKEDIQRNMMFEFESFDLCQHPQSLPQVKSWFKTNLQKYCGILESDLNGVLSEQAKKTLATKVFLELDKDNSGELDSQELRKLIKKVEQIRFCSTFKAKKLIYDINKSSSKAKFSIREEIGLANNFVDTIKLDSFLTYYTSKIKNSKEENSLAKNLVAEFKKHSEDNVWSQVEYIYYQQTSHLAKKLVVQLKNQLYCELQKRFEKIMFSEEDAREFFNTSIIWVFQNSKWTIDDETKIMLLNELNAFFEFLIDHYDSLDDHSKVQAIAMGISHSVLVTRSGVVWVKGIHKSGDLISQVRDHILNGISSVKPHLKRKTKESVDSRHE